MAEKKDSAKTDAAQSEKDSRIAELEAQLSEMREQLAGHTQMAAPAGVEPVRVDQGVPDMEVVVNDGSRVTVGDKEYTGGKKVTLPGPMAQNLQLAGYVTIKG